MVSEQNGPDICPKQRAWAYIEIQWNAHSLVAYIIEAITPKKKT